MMTDKAFPDLIIQGMIKSGDTGRGRAEHRGFLPVVVHSHHNLGNRLYLRTIFNAPFRLSECRYVEDYHCSVQP
jgi:hypothetical protein